MAHWFFPLVGIAYAAGFLIVFTFSRSFGIDGAELLQGKYIHVGSLFVMACIVVALPILWFFYLVKAMKGGRLPLASILGLALYGSMLFTFYVVVAFTERGFFHRHGLVVLGNFVVPLIYSLLRLSLPAYIRARAIIVFTWIVGALGCIAQGYLTYRTLIADQLWQHLVEIFPLWPPSGVYGFILLMALSLAYAAVAVVRWDERTDIQSRFTIGFSTFCLLSFLFYLSILAFAYAVYPHIPSGKGGGFFADSVPVRILFRNAPSSTGDVRFAMTAEDSPFVMLYQNSESVFLASKNDAGGPEEWQKPASPKPRVHELRRETVEGITYLNPTPTPSPTAVPAP
jgi:hypothetical protein